MDMLQRRSRKEKGLLRGIAAVDSFETGEFGIEKVVDEGHQHVF